MLLAEGDVALALVRPGAQLALHTVLNFLRQGLLSCGGVEQHVGSDQLVRGAFEE